LPPQDQLALVEHITGRLRVLLAPLPAAPTASQAERDRETTEILALMDEAAAMWDGKFDSAAEISQMRQEGDEDEADLRRREQEADEYLAHVDAIAAMTTGEFDSAADIRRMRRERDEQVAGRVRHR